MSRQAALCKISRIWLASVATAAGAIGDKLDLVQFDEVLGRPSGAVERLVDMLGRPRSRRSLYEADVEVFCSGFDPGTDTAICLPGSRLVAGLGEAAQARLLTERAAGASVVGRRVDQPVEHGVAR